MSGEDESARVEAQGPTVYVETSVISYLTADPSRDIVTLAHQRITRDWWEERGEFSLFSSLLTVLEARMGDPAMIARRLQVLAQLPLLDASDASAALAAALLRRGPLPQKAASDAAHIAIAATSGMEYLVTWNLKHIANPAMRGRIEGVCRDHGVDPPILCTPENLLER